MGQNEIWQVYNINLYVDCDGRVYRVLSGHYRCSDCPGICGGIKVAGILAVLLIHGAEHVCKSRKYALEGLNGYQVTVEADIFDGLPAYETVGLPGTAVKESKERIRSAIKNSNLKYPTRRITVNLAPG